MTAPKPFLIEKTTLFINSLGVVCYPIYVRIQIKSATSPVHVSSGCNFDDKETVLCLDKLMCHDDDNDGNDRNA